MLLPCWLPQVQFELRRLGKEERTRQEHAVQEVLKGAQVGARGGGRRVGMGVQGVGCRTQCAVCSVQGVPARCWAACSLGSLHVVSITHPEVISCCLAMIAGARPCVAPVDMDWK